MEDALQPRLCPWQPVGTADRGPKGPTLRLPPETVLLLRIDPIHTSVEPSRSGLLQTSSHSELQ